LARALVQFQDALRFDAGYREAHEGLAEVYQAQGRRADAAAERAKAGAPVAKP
jgi:Tfp pilus assembly protein PilF